MDPVLVFWGLSGATVPVAPSYHYAVSNSFAYTLLRTAIVSERLGGIPVYMAGDEGLVFLPAWLPWSLSTPAYRGELARAAGIGEDGEGFVLPSPAAVVGVLLPRLLWASSAAAPGFHPVKERGRGRKVLYRIPALLGSGASAGLRLSHYRDHLYSEIAAAEEAMEEGKGRGGARLAVAMGRVAATRPGEAVEAAAVLPLLPGGASTPYGMGPGELRRAARLPAAAAVLAGLVASEGASQSLLRGHMMLFSAPPGRALEAIRSMKGREAERIARYLASRYTGGKAAEEAAKKALEAAEKGEELVEVLTAALALYNASARTTQQQ